MREKLFQELLDSVREAGAILRGEKKASRTFEYAEEDVRWVRARYGLSQAKFAALPGISVATLRNREQGRRQPEGSARVLLRVVARHPSAVLDVVGVSAPGPNKRLKRTAQETRHDFRDTVTYSRSPREPNSRGARPKHHAPADAHAGARIATRSAAARYLNLQR
jgi:putative transcriptional regulator